MQRLIIRPEECTVQLDGAASHVCYLAESIVITRALARAVRPDKHIILIVCLVSTAEVEQNYQLLGL